MFAAALLDLGVPLPLFQDAIQGLHLPEKVNLKTERSLRGGLAGTRFLVETPHEHNSHHHSHPHDHSHEHEHGRSWAQIRTLLQNYHLTPPVNDLPPAPHSLTLSDGWRRSLSIATQDDLRS